MLRRGFAARDAPVSATFQERSHWEIPTHHPPAAPRGALGHSWGIPLWNTGMCRTVTHGITEPFLTLALGLVCSTRGQRRADVSEARNNRAPPRPSAFPERRAASAAGFSRRLEAVPVISGSPWEGTEGENCSWRSCPAPALLLAELSPAPRPPPALEGPSAVTFPASLPLSSPSQVPSPASRSRRAQSCFPSPARSPRPGISLQGPLQRQSFALL